MQNGPGFTRPWLRALWSKLESPDSRAKLSIVFCDHGWRCIYWAQEFDWGKKSRRNCGSSEGIAARSALQKSGPAWKNHALVLWIVAASPWLQRITRACWRNQVHQSSRVLWPKSTCAISPMEALTRAAMAHRYDSMCIVNGMINSGLSCQLIHYTHEEHDKFFELCKSFDFVIVRCNPGQIKADGGDQQKFDDGMRGLRKMGKEIWPSPDVMEKMGAKDALCKVATMNIGLEDTLAYYSPEEFSVGFKKTMAFQPRVIKQNRGSSGEGIWIIKLKAENYCANYGDRSCEDDEKLVLMEANDNHEEEHTVAEFIEFCVSGRTDKSGEWTSKGVGKYLEGGKEAGGQLVDQRFVHVLWRVSCATIWSAIPWSESFTRNRRREESLQLAEPVPSTPSNGPEEPLFKSLTGKFPEDRLAPCDACLDLAAEPIPLWWTTDFILASPVGTPTEQEKWIVGEFNCSCVGISRCLAAYCKDDTPNASWDDISEEDKAEAKKMGDLMGEKALKILSKWSPSKPTCLINCTLH